MTVRRENGQATALTVVFLVALLGMAALVLDLGAWYRADRDTQSTVDAAALAGAQALPDSTDNASSLASTYASKNGGGLDSVSFASSFAPNDTITVKVKRTVLGFFTRLFGFASADVGSKATARVATMTQAKYVAPIAVNQLHPMLHNAGCPCYGPANATTLPLGKTGAPGAFDLLNLDQSRGGTSPQILADWMLHGYDAYLPLGNYYSDPGAKFNSSAMQAALQARIGSVLLFPVYDTLTGNGANAQYHVIGWAGFYLTGFQARGSSGSITGYFTETLWTGLQPTSGQPPTPDFGARSIQLIE